MISNGIQTPTNTTSYPKVVRPSKHKAGEEFYVVRTPHELTLAQLALGPDHYVSDLIEKVSEYRVYLVQQKIVNITRKVPHDPSLPIWNVATGNCHFAQVKWGDWPMNVAEQAVKAFAISGLDFGAVDVIVDADDVAYVLEVNSAPAMPLLSDGSYNYRLKCLAKGIDYIIANDDKTPISTDQYETWKDVIHPALWAPEEISGAPLET
jgi:hypothetical protein